MKEQVKVRGASQGRVCRKGHGSSVLKKKESEDKGIEGGKGEQERPLCRFSTIFLGSTGIQQMNLDSI